MGDATCLAQRERPSEPSATTVNHASETSERQKLREAHKQSYKPKKKQ